MATAPRTVVLAMVNALFALVCQRRAMITPSNNGNRSSSSPGSRNINPHPANLMVGTTIQCHDRRTKRIVIIRKTHNTVIVY